jgi:hypothetical protein
MKKLVNLLVLLILAAGCRKPYNPPAVRSTAGYLVVEGVVSSGADSTIIKLNHTVNIASKVTANPVLHAQVSVESDQGASYPLTETSNGNYVSPGLNLDNTRTYRLSIKTPDNKQYQSDLAPVVVTPPIDSIGFNIVTLPVPGIQIYVDTHDPSNTAKYFRWGYDEAWAFQAKYISYWITNGTTLVPRLTDQNITLCYTNDISSNVVIASSAKLQQDSLYQSPILFIPSTSEKIANEYSILLRQYALTADAYNFWVSLKKNTEQLGSIFDAQPTQLEGNIHCITNPAEPVIGYVSVCKISSKRVFIPRSLLPAWTPTYPYSCELDTDKTYTSEWYNDLVNNPKSPLIPTGPPPPALGYPAAFAYSTRVCVDCTIRGTKTAPSFWRVIH